MANLTMNSDELDDQIASDLDETKTAGQIGAAMLYEIFQCASFKGIHLTDI